MIARTITKLRGALLGAAAAALVLTTTTALAGSGVGGVFNLGQVNTVDAQTTLSGNPGANPQLKVTTAGTAAAVRGDASIGIGVNGTSVSGIGQQGQSQSGTGLFGVHSATTGTSPGVEGRTSSTDPNGAGVLGRNNGAGPGLRSIVSAGAPPLAVNSSVKVANLNADLLDGLDSSGLPYWKLGGNAGTTPGTDFLGTTDNQALELKVNGQRALRIEPATAPNLIGGYVGNSADPGVIGATIAGGGGGSPGTENRVTGGIGTVGGGWKNSAGGSATVAGGEHNTASGIYAVVGGGINNTASGGPTGAAVVAGGNGNSANGSASTVGGGGGNTAGAGSAATVSGGLSNSALDFGSAVGGGSGNSASGSASVVAGGISNTASGGGSIVPGGLFNEAAGESSFAAGNQAKANHNGAFVWADSQVADMASSGTDQFIARAQGHFFLQSDSTLDDQSGFINTSTGAFLSTGGTWTNASSRSLKAGFAPVSPLEILEKVASLPLTTWHYKAEPGVRHIGPVSEDFHRAFGLGENSKSIPTVDADGVALAAIKGLYRQNLALQRRVASLERKLKEGNR